MVHANLRHFLFRDVGAEEELVRFAGGHRLAIEEALHIFAAEFLQFERAHQDDPEFIALT